MKTFGPLKIASAFLAASMIAVPAYADRGPTQDEAKAIAAKLTAEGFKSWEEIELDNDGPYWEIDDARAMDGKKYDLKLSPRSEEHTSELQSLMRISYAVFCLKKKKQPT